MTTIDESSTAAHAAPDTKHDTGPDEAAVAAAGANPALVGVPTFVIGGVALGLYLVGFTGSSDNAAMGMLPILFLATGVGQLIGCLWAIRNGQGPVATIFGVFGGFWWSFPLLAVGLAHGWFGDATQTAVQASAKETFLLSWLVLIVVLTIGGLRLPAIFTALFVLVDLALLLTLLGVAANSTGLLFAAGIAVWAFSLVGVYIFVDAMGQATGGKPMPMGKPIISS